MKVQTLNAAFGCKLKLCPQTKMPTGIFLSLCSMLILNLMLLTQQGVFVQVSFLGPALYMIGILNIMKKDFLKMSTLSCAVHPKKMKRTSRLQHNVLKLHVLEFIFLYNIFYDKGEVIYQCKNVSLAAFSLLPFFDFIDLLTFTSVFRNIAQLRGIYNLLPKPL